MPILKFTVLGLFAVLLFIGNVGVNVFIHHCDEDGDLVSFIFNESDEHCDAHKEVELSCCHSDEPIQSDEDGISENNECCSDEIAYFQLKSEYSSTDNDEKVQQPVAIITYLVEIPNHTQLFDYYTSNYVNPPPLNSRQILQKKQVWII
ncbi:MAG: hypothetical protein QNK23_16665 [Crocinitomicaceae bacterium]|nr:hypothetical protein [Crocinitomicaceae bacterium]